MKRFSLFDAAGPLFLLILWQAASALIGSEIILPSPIDVAHRLFRLLFTQAFYIDLLMSLARIAAGIIITIAIGTAAGILSGSNKHAAKIFLPLAHFFQSVPAIAWLLIALVWFPSATVPVFVIVFSAYPILTINIAEGFLGADKKIVQMALYYNVPPKRQIMQFYIPAVTTYISSSIKIIIGISVKAGIMAEVLSHPGNGIGEKMSWARINLESIDLFVYTAVTVAITSVMLFLFNLKNRTIQ